MEMILAVLILVALLTLWIVLPATKSEHKAHAGSAVTSFQQRA